MTIEVPTHMRNTRKKETNIRRYSANVHTQAWPLFATEMLDARTMAPWSKDEIIISRYNPIIKR